MLGNYAMTWGSFGIILFKRSYIPAVRKIGECVWMFLHCSEFWTEDCFAKGWPAGTESLKRFTIIFFQLVPTGSCSLPRNDYMPFPKGYEGKCRHLISSLLPSLSLISSHLSPNNSSPHSSPLLSLILCSSSNALSFSSSLHPCARLSPWWIIVIIVGKGFLMSSCWLNLGFLDGNAWIGFLDG